MPTNGDASCIEVVGPSNGALPKAATVFSVVAAEATPARPVTVTDAATIIAIATNAAMARPAVR